MGSLFLAVIPIRSFEFRLRLKENHVYSLPVTSIEVIDNDVQGTLLKNVQKSFRNETPVVSIQKENEITSKDIMLPAKKEMLEAYTMDKDGVKMLLEVTRDKMKLTQVAKLKELEQKTASFNSLTSIEDTTERNTILSTTLSLSSLNRFEDTELTELINNQFLEKHMEDALTKFDLLKAVWEHSIDENFSTITFAVKADKSDEIINHLHLAGIGKKYQSTLSVCSTSVFNQEGQLDTVEIEEEKSKWNNFVQSIKARLTVAQVVQNVQADAVMTFDFIIMVTVAGIISSIGLLENSPVNIIASMLTSPLMNPIMAFTFGAVIRDVPLIKTGVISELWGLWICIIVGFIFGLFAESNPIKGPWHGIDQWPTPEMFSRSELRSLVIGAGIAIPSGAGVALSILAGNSGSLVGVAISASLLPPCVNCGILYGMTLVIAVNQAMHGHNPFTSSCDTKIGVESFVNHTVLYCQNALIEYTIMGTISLCITLSNIVLIFLTGLVVLKIKEVAPYTSKKVFERFWKHDLRQARDYNIEHKGVKDALLTGIEDNPNLLNAVEDDFVFNRIRNRVPDENIIEKLKSNKRYQGQDRWTDGAESNKGGWFSGWFSFGEAKEDVETKGASLKNPKKKSP